ncbi:MAG: class I SAM-dependent methyltransferase [Chitinivibrionales bacterium]|nr:class I SAM-dependent methyltransferase [Chitinivibrionales bacterium]
MHLPTLVRKTNFRLFGKIALADTVRNFAYAWAWGFLRRLPKESRICDIGSRATLFPAFLAWRGFNVSIVEKDERFTGVQRLISGHWNVAPDIFSGNFLELSGDVRYNAILSVFSLQHAGENDLPAFRKAAAMLAPGGLLLSVCEYNPVATQWHKERDDGALRIYGPQDISERIERPLLEKGLSIVEKKYAGLTKGKINNYIVWQNDSKNGAFFFLCAEKKQV